jgi:hypothetical protein
LRHLINRDPATLVCNFDIADQQAEKKRRASGGTKVANLEAKIGKPSFKMQ